MKLSNVGRSSDECPNLLYRATPCFGRHVKLLVLAAFALGPPGR
jgi:hypothetical protein